MVKKLTRKQMQKNAVLARVRTEATILRAMWLNEVLPAIEDEIDRRITAGEHLDLDLPEIDQLAGNYIEDVFRINKYEQQEQRQLRA